MAETPTIRRLAAILAADVVGFSRMMGSDEEGTLARLKRLRRPRLCLNPMQIEMMRPLSTSSVSIARR